MAHKKKHHTLYIAFIGNLDDAPNCHFSHVSKKLIITCEVMYCSMGLKNNQFVDKQIPSDDQPDIQDIHICRHHFVSTSYCKQKIRMQFGMESTTS